MTLPSPHRNPSPNWAQWLHDFDQRRVARLRPQDANGPGPEGPTKSLPALPRWPNPRARKTGWTGVLWFCTFLVSLGSLYLLVVGAGGRPRLDSSRKLLQTPLSSPKLTVRKESEPVLLAVAKSAADMEPPLSYKMPLPGPAPLRPGPLPELPPVPVVAQATVAVPTLEPRVELPTLPLQAPLPLPVPVPAPEKLTFDIIENPPFLALDPRGDTPMLRNWKNLALLAATIIVIQQPPVVQAQSTADADIKALLGKLDKMESSLQKSFEAISQDLSNLKKDITTLRGDYLTQQVTLDKANGRLSTLEKQMQGVRQDLDALKNKSTSDSPLPPVVDKSNIDDIKLRLTQIEQSLAKLQTNANRISLSPPSAGRVVLVNLYNEDLLFLINQKPFRVAPNTSMPIDSIPAGNMTYEVISGTFGMRARNTINLAPNETFTLTAR